MKHNRSVDSRLLHGVLLDVTVPLVRGACQLSPAPRPTQGSRVAGGVPGLPNYHLPILKLATGEQLFIVPRRIEHAAGQPALLLFEVEL